jgi:N-acetylneuraminic acid mutarotase
MKKRTTSAFMFMVGILLIACGLIQPQIAPVEVTRIVKETVAVTRIVRQTVLVTPRAPLVLKIHVTPGSPLLIARALHTATRLKDGRILLAGGSQASDEHLAVVEIFNPVTGKTGWAASLHTARHGHTATLLPDGRVLVVGGYNVPDGWLSDAEVYDPSSNSWTVVPPLTSHGVSHTATLMKDGRVLVAGGCIGSGVCTNQVEIFDPITNIWTNATPLAGDRASQTAILLDDGRVLLAGGGSETGAPAGGDALLFDPKKDTWTATGRMVTPGGFAQSVRLPDGRVLVAGGMSQADASTLAMTASAEIYDPASNKWTAVPSLSQPRYAFSMISSPDGRVLAIGGTRDHENNIKASSFILEIESYDWRVNRWSVAGNLPQPEAFATACLLTDGRVWVTGGQTGRTPEDFSSETMFLTPLLVQP